MAPASGASIATAPGTTTASGGAPSPAQGSGVSGAVDGARNVTQRAQQPGGPAQFNIASFNALGASHTAKGGNKPGMRSGTDRAKGLVDYLHKHKVDVVGLQEFEPSQQAAFKKLAPEYQVIGEGANSVAFRKDAFKVVKRQTVKVPYFGGKMTDMPVVQLEDRATGKRAWFISIHNPADTKAHPGNEGNRNRAEQIERDYIERLKASGLPVFIVGDFNERGDARKAMTSGGFMTASDSSGGADEIDWIFGSGATFSASTVDRSTKSSGTSDHPMVVTTAHI
jgi:endonuclease/exonuclease/phosphatase family metal-dependent hydrolase